MCNILFTKKDLDEATLSKALKKSLEIHYTEVLEIEPLEIVLSDFKNKSLVFTSVHGVESVLNNKNFKEASATFHLNKFYVVGEKSKMALQKAGFEIFVVKKNAAELVEFILEHGRMEEFIHFCGDIALDTLEKNLNKRNVLYQKTVVYQTILKYPVVKGEYDAVVFFSPSGVRSFLKWNTIEGKKTFSIGETTSDELKKYSKEKIFTSEQSTLSDVLHLINKEL